MTQATSERLSWLGDDVGSAIAAGGDRAQAKPPVIPNAIN